MAYLRISGGVDNFIRFISISAGEPHFHRYFFSGFEMVKIDAIAEVTMGAPVKINNVEGLILNQKRP